MSRRSAGRSGNSPTDGFLSTLARPRTIFCLAFLIRVLSIPLAVFRITPYSQADATGFSTVAGIIATRGVSGAFSDVAGYGTIYEVWGTLLSPFWLLPVGGPVLARIVLSLLAAYAIYNVVLITRRLGTPMVGLVAGLPLVFYPSVFLVQSTLLREAAVLFGVTTAARFLLVASDYSRGRATVARPRRRRIALVTLAIGCLTFATLLRRDNFILYVLGIAGGGIGYYSTSWRGKAAGVVAILVGGLGARALNDRIIERFNIYRQVRAIGRASYLESVRFDTLLDMVAFAPVGIAYFLFAPFPWMVGSPLDIPVLFEGLVNIVYAAAGFVGVVLAFKRDRVATIGLLVYFVFGVALYSLGTANYGTGIRHRQMFSWVLFIFGGVGMHWLWLQYAPSNWKRPFVD